MWTNALQVFRLRVMQMLGVRIPLLLSRVHVTRDTQATVAFARVSITSNFQQLFYSFPAPNACSWNYSISCMPTEVYSSLIDISLRFKGFIDSVWCAVSSSCDVIILRESFFVPRRASISSLHFLLRLFVAWYIVEFASLLFELLALRDGATLCNKIGKCLRFPTCLHCHASQQDHSPFFTT